MRTVLEKILKNDDFFQSLFGNDPHLIEAKRRMLEIVLSRFSQRFGNAIQGGVVHLVTAPNRVELLGKHTDYQGGETLLLTGPKNFFALAAPSADGITHLVNADPDLGETVFKIQEGALHIIEEGVGANYSRQVVTRLTNNLARAGFPPLRNVKAVFLGDIPIGGGTSGSSAKVITDFLVLTSSSGLIENEGFKRIIISNGEKAGLRMNQQGLDNYLLSLSMYIAHYENGLDFGELKGDRGVGTFGGSEDHTAIILGKKNRLLFCRYCPTELIETVFIPDGYSVVVAYSGKRAEKTKNAMAQYNRLSGDASAAVDALNRINGTSNALLRDFFQDLEPHERTEAVRDQLKRVSKSGDFAGRAYQFFRELDIIYRAVACLKEELMEEYGRLINESHDLSREYLKNIAPEVDGLQQSANKLGALGATGFGGGFGGSCYAVVEARRTEDFIGAWRKAYLDRFPQYRELAEFDVYPACAGARWESQKLCLME